MGATILVVMIAAYASGATSIAMIEFSNRAACEAAAKAVIAQEKRATTLCVPKA